MRLRGARSGLGAGVDSRVQPTARLLSAYGQGASAVASPNLNGLGAGVDSRVQPTARLLSAYGRGASAVASPAPITSPAASPITSMPPAPADAAFKAGVNGAATAALAKGLTGANWLFQGVGLALAAEFISKALDPKAPERTEIETKADVIRAARAASNPFLGGSMAGPGYDQTIKLPLHGKQQGMGAAGAAAGAAASAGGKGASGQVLAAFGGPVGLAIMGATTAITQYIGFRARRNARKVATTQIVNEAQPLLERNLEAWHNSPKTKSAQAQALANFDAVWEEVKYQCGKPEMGTPGRWCVEHRSRGGSWPWEVYWRDPIANDPNVIEDPPQGFQAVRDPETGEVVEVPTEETQLRNTLVPFVLAGAALYFVTS